MRELNNLEKKGRSAAAKKQFIIIHYRWISLERFYTVNARGLLYTLLKSPLLKQENVDEREIGTNTDSHIFHDIKLNDSSYGGWKLLR